MDTASQDDALYLVKLFLKYHCSASICQISPKFDQAFMFKLQHQHRTTLVFKVTCTDLPLSSLQG